MFAWQNNPSSETISEAIERLKVEKGLQDDSMLRLDWYVRFDPFEDIEHA